MVRREVMDGKPPTKYAPHATHNEWRAGRPDIPPLMTSQALTIGARHTSSTVPTRPRRRHSLRDNEWCAIERALIAEVRRPFLSHHSTCQSIALGAGAILTLYRSTPGGPRTPWCAAVGHRVPVRATPHRRASRPIAFLSNDAIPGAPRRAHCIPLVATPNLFAMRRRAPRAPDNQNGRLTEKRMPTCDRGRTHCAPGTQLANMGARIARPERIFRNVGVRIARPRKTCETPAQPLCAQKDAHDRGRTHGAP